MKSYPVPIIHSERFDSLLRITKESWVIFPEHRTRLEEGLRDFIAAHILKSLGNGETAKPESITELSKE